MTTTLQRLFWTSRSGRLHGMKTCSANGAAMQKTMLNPDQWRAHTNKCKCARWSSEERKERWTLGQSGSNSR